MKRNIHQSMETYTHAHRNRRRWYKAVTCLAAIVVFCTVYALVLPAITLEKDPCSLAEHTHTESCYTQVTAVAKTVPDCALEFHTHTDDCLDKDGNPVCCYADFVVHKHDTNCRLPDGSLWCTLPEIEAHIHDDSCYTPAHSHTEACYTPVQGDLTCQEEESEAHTHSDECYAWENTLTCTESTEPVLTCEKPVVIPHIHTPYVSEDQPGCYDKTGEQLICGQVEIQEHQHTAACLKTVEEPADTTILTCQIPVGEGGHIHVENCYAADGTLTCPLEETPGHQHTSRCYGTWELTCGKQEHTHSEACQNTAAQQENALAGTRLTGDWRQDVITIAQTQLGYTESSEDFITDDDGVQHGYTSYGDWYGSPYADWRAIFVSYCIHYAGVENMPLDICPSTWVEKLSQEDLYLFRSVSGDTPYTPATGDLIFFSTKDDGLADHVGLVSQLIPAFGEEPAKLTVIGESADRQVQYGTYFLDDPTILGYGQLPAQTFYCGKTGHIHTEKCGQACAQEEHIHTDSCMTPAEEAAPAQLTFIGPDYTVAVSYGADAMLPDGVTLSVSEIPADSSEYQIYLDQAKSAMDTSGPADQVVFARFFDIQFLLNGEKLEPAAPVSVTITYAQPVETAEDSNCQAVHFTEDGTEVLDVTTQQQEDGSTSFTHTQTGFSVVGNVVTVMSVANPADIGPERFPVDYYVCIDGTWTCVGSTKTGWYGDYAATDWTDTNRDYITVAQAESILGKYGFSASVENPARLVAYQQKTNDLKLYSDTNTVEIDGNRVIPLARNKSGFNLYYLPANTSWFAGTASSDALDKEANGFYTVKIYDALGRPLISETVRRGSRFTYDAAELGVTSWLAAYGNGTTQALASTSIIIENITSSVIVSPAPKNSGVGSHSVTFKVMIAGEWKTVGSLPYYFTGDFGGSQRAYVTSAMAAQFFGDFGYSATEDPGYHFGYSYNDIHTLYYANGTTKVDFCMDVAGGKFADSTIVQLWKSNYSDSQVFRIWDAGNGYSYITPINHSDLFVNAYGYTSGDPSLTPLKLSIASNTNSQWRVDTGSDGRTTFWSAIQPTEQVIDLNNNKVENGGVLQLWSYTGGARYWYMEQLYRISNNIVSVQNADGTYNIGLTAESNGDIVCYYLPGETSAVYSGAAETAISSSNSLLSVTVRDDTHSVYSQGELDAMTQVVVPGSTVTVTVQNAEGILWSCVSEDKTNIQASQADGKTTFTITNIAHSAEIIATKDNPTFTVQYYANIPRFATSGDISLSVIDTSGKKLPKNGDTSVPFTPTLFLENTGRTTDQNAGDATALYQVKTINQLTEMYTAETDCHFLNKPNLSNFNKLSDSGNYELKEVWVLLPGKDSSSTNRGDWKIYTVQNGEIGFTNLAYDESEDMVLITDGSVLRLVYDTSTGDYVNGTTFYDYNISDGQNPDGRWRTGITGINSESNYGSSLNNQRTWKSTADIFAFGNANCGTGMSGYWFDGGPLNKWNGTNKNYAGRNADYGGATFGLAAGLNQDGTIRYNEWIVAPKLFNDGDATGKQTYGGNLVFNRTGDTYTLTAANVNGAQGRSDLQYFFTPSPYGGKIYDTIYTNNFWPMDNANSPDKVDAEWGKYNNRGTFAGYTETNNHDWSSLDGTFPPGDDGNAHNWFFGMNFAINFTLTEDYVGPLEYYFFGDDDLWVFLDGTLVCDIGGVHSSIGEYVNLRDYLPIGSKGNHTLSLFYTERGASGSTCYMNFTLPTPATATTKDVGSLQITKGVENTGGQDFSQEEYQFTVELKTSENGTDLPYRYSYTRTKSDDDTYEMNGSIKSGEVLKMKQNEIVTITGIPAGTYYCVTELTTDGYFIIANNNAGHIVAGTVSTGQVHPAAFINRVQTELPNTGGCGTWLFTLSGAGLIVLSLAFRIWKKREKVDPV